MLKRCSTSIALFRKKVQGHGVLRPLSLRRKAFRLLPLFRTRPCALPGKNVFPAFPPSLPKETGHEHTVCPEKIRCPAGRVHKKKEGRLSRQPAEKSDPKHPCPDLSVFLPGQRAASSACRRRTTAAFRLPVPAGAAYRTNIRYRGRPSPALPLRHCVIPRRGVVPMPRRGEVQTST